MLEHRDGKTSLEANREVELGGSQLGPKSLRMQATSLKSGPETWHGPPHSSAHIQIIFLYGPQRESKPPSVGFFKGKFHSIVVKILRSEKPISQFTSDWGGKNLITSLQIKLHVFLQTFFIRVWPGLLPRISNLYAHKVCMDPREKARHHQLVSSKGIFSQLQ